MFDVVLLDCLATTNQWSELLTTQLIRMPESMASSSLPVFSWSSISFLLKPVYSRYWSMERVSGCHGRRMLHFMNNRRARQKTVKGKRDNICFPWKGCRLKSGHRPFFVLWQRQNSLQTGTKQTINLRRGKEMSQEKLSELVMIRQTHQTNNVNLAKDSYGQFTNRTWACVKFVRILLKSSQDKTEYLLQNLTDHRSVCQILRCQRLGY